MTTVTYSEYGYWCYSCQEVHDDTDSCDHFLDKKAGIQKDHDGNYFAQPNNMGHRSPHVFIDVNGMKQCAECDRVKIPSELIDGDDQ